MRNSLARYTFVTLTILGLAGCQSGNGWSMRSLAFWSTDDSSALPEAPEVTTPTLPSSVTGTAGMPTPGAGYESSTASTMAPPTSYPTARCS